ncbi:Uncharacterised protein [Legionella beliardensis]|uniref:Uncharacterized protein n=1 Tax=Legionella beliardensis TaxID=91822 RepID=A0A378HXH7_9GAMM|nr:hypothetical protein [Legionella beliardensis]STX27607.1 Uncharacterised protein [Legionella beliardensis]
MQNKIETCGNGGSKVKIEMCYSFSHENKALFIACSHTPTGVRSIVTNARAKGGLFSNRELNYNDHEGLKNWLEAHLIHITNRPEYEQVEFILVAADVNLASSGKRDLPLFLRDNSIKNCLTQGDNVVIKKILFSTSADVIELANQEYGTEGITYILTDGVRKAIEKTITDMAGISPSSDPRLFRRNSDAITAPSAEAASEDSPTLNYKDLS